MALKSLTSSMIPSLWTGRTRGAPLLGRCAGRVRGPALRLDTRAARAWISERRLRPATHVRGTRTGSPAAGWLGLRQTLAQRIGAEAEGATEVAELGVAQIRG